MEIQKTGISAPAENSRIGIASAGRLAPENQAESWSRFVWLIWLLPIVVSLWYRPIFPVDETRYLSVAWSMWRDGDFIVPYLNGMPYAHKPPLLFWLINLGWAVFGPNEYWPRFIQPLFATGSMVLLYRIARNAWPASSRAATMAPMLFAGTWFVTLYTPAIMFDMLVVFFTLVTWLGLSGDRPRWWLVTLGLALGLLAKGPVIFVYTMPALLAAPMWRSRPARGWSGWYRPMFAAFAMALVPVLVWLFLVWLRLDPAFIEEVIWEQTANRLSGQIGHGRPAWWYLEFLPLVCLPWLAWPPAWRALRAGFHDRASRLFLGAGAGAFLILSMIGGKQLHYLLPVLALVALGLAHGLASRTEMRRSDSWIAAMPVVIVGLLLASVAAGLFGDRVPAWAGDIPLAWPLALIMVAIMLGALSSRDVRSGLRIQLATSSILALTFMAGPVVASRTAFDLTTASRKIGGFQSDARPVAFLGHYHGEFDFLGRLAGPLDVVDAEAVPAWLDAHPGGVLVTRHRNVDGYHPPPIYAQPYRSGGLEMFSARELAEEDVTYVN